jgi:hypothetical protein
MRGKGNGVEARKIFVNAQWALGGAGTGAPVCTESCRAAHHTLSI